MLSAISADTRAVVFMVCPECGGDAMMRVAVQPCRSNFRAAHAHYLTDTNRAAVAVNSIGGSVSVWRFNDPQAPE